MSPPIELLPVSGDDQLRLSFWHWFVIQGGGTADIAQVHVSTDNGVEWHNVSPINYDGYGMDWTRTCVDRWSLWKGLAAGVPWNPPPN